MFLQKNWILCVTSLSWLKNAMYTFQQPFRKTGLFVSTVACSLASLNLWRDYNKFSTRWNIDVLIARVTAVYYVLLYKKHYQKSSSIDSLYICSANSCYFMSSVVFKSNENISLFFHTLFHLNVFKIQKRLIEY